MSDRALDDFMAVSKALADASRVRILALLEARPLCVCQITEILDLAPSTVSKHLAVLRQARLLETKKEGRWIHCRVTDHARRRLSSEIRGSARLREDRRRLAAVLRIEPETLCRRQLRRRNGRRP